VESILGVLLLGALIVLGIWMRIDDWKARAPERPGNSDFAGDPGGGFAAGYGGGACGDSGGGGHC
jgi:hypothetical protein